jgi:DNA processing protein
VVYPRENRELFEEIAAKGAIISEFPLGTPPEATNFPARNRIISGLALGVLVVEAAEDGGALITADFALEQGRDVFAVPGAITNHYSRGTNRLIKEGAKLVEGVADILEEYPALMLTPQSTAPEQLSLSLDSGLNFGKISEKKKSANRPAAKARTLANLEESEPVNLGPAEKQLLSQLSLEPVVVDKLIADSGLTPSQVISILIFLEMRGLVQQLPGRRYVLGKKLFNN